MNKLALAFVAAIAIGSFAASTADAMNIGSLSRQRPVADSAELVTSSIPAIRDDRAFGGGNSKPADFIPVLHIIFASLSDLVRSHADVALGNSLAVRAQPASMASAD